MFSAAIAALAILAQEPPGSPNSQPWLQFGLLGLVIVGILYLRVIVPGWVYQAEVARVARMEERLAAQATAHAEEIKAKDAEIARLRDLAEDRTIPLLERALVLVERVEGSWGEPLSPQQPYSGAMRRGPRGLE